MINSSPNRIQQIAEATESERGDYLEAIGWEDNPFSHQATMNEYVLPSEGTIADIASHIRDYTGPVLVHSRYSGVGKTTLLNMLLESYTDEYQPVLIGVDEFGLNSKDTLHTIQYMNDLPNTRVLMTGMTSQWEAIGKIGSDGRAFQRRVAYDVQLEPLEYGGIDEMVRRRIATVTDYDHDQYTDVDLGPITDDALEEIHERSSGVPAVATAALSELVGLAAYRYAQVGDAEITADLASKIEYADPEADLEESS